MRNDNLGWPGAIIFLIADGGDVISQLPRGVGDGTGAGGGIEFVRASSSCDMDMVVMV